MNRTLRSRLGAFELWLRPSGAATCPSRRSDTVPRMRILLLAVAVAVAVAVLGGVAHAKPTPIVSYPHHDVFGNTVARTDSAGAPLWTARPDPFGEVTPSSRKHAARFANKPGEYDWSADGVAYPMGARLYLPYLGRFGAADPLAFDQLTLGNPQAFNRYVYALNNPFRYQDPTGLISEEARALVNEIYYVVAADAEMRLRVGRNDMGIEMYIPNGTIRNQYFLFTGKMGSYEGFAAVCTGISEQAVRLIGLAVARGQLSNIAIVGTIETTGDDHTAVYVKLKSGEEIVLDWHATLNIAHPRVSTAEAFCKTGKTCDRGGTDPRTIGAKPYEAELKLIRSYREESNKQQGKK